MEKRFLYLLIIISFSSCSSDDGDVLFSSISNTSSGINFKNELKDSPEFNIMEYLYYYNGGGVTAGDVNNDGLVDLFFSGNQVNDALYINKGNLTFEDVSVSSGINQNNGWSTGVSMVDINADGWLDIYVCRLGEYKIYKDHNQLYINQKNGTFLEMSAQYGLDFSGFSTQAAFLDYDQDGDLDCYLLNHSVKRPDQFVKASEIRIAVDSIAGDRLLRNDYGQFVDVSKDAGILSSNVGFGLGIATADINNDGWQDIYVGNDFHENDYLYINNQDGTFRNTIEESVGHTSNFTMGTTISDINSDGTLDIISLDMQPDNENVYKQSGGWENMQIYNFKRSYGYHHQSPKNAIQINLGNSDKSPVFSEQSSMLGMNATDWSWSPLVADFDLDGDQDVFITNGIPRRPNDMDFVNFMSDSKNFSSGYQEMIDVMGSGEAQNVIFYNTCGKYIQKNIGDPGISNGACLADLDNDGDWDIVTNNIDDYSSVWVNNTNPERYLKIRLKDTTNNRNGLGARVFIESSEDGEGMSMNQLISSASGFQSMNENVAIFPFSNHSERIKVIWSDGTETIDLLPRNKNEIIVSNVSKTNYPVADSLVSSSVDVLDFGHEDIYFNDQNNDPLLPYLRSNLSPKMVSNLNGEIYVSQGKGKNGYILSRDFKSKLFTLNRRQDLSVVDETGAAFFDADGDGDQDIYICHGGMELLNGNLSLMDRLYTNEAGQYINSDHRLPLIANNTSTVAPYDYDQDGDIDLFVGVQGIANKYGQTEESYILENVNNKDFKPVSLGLSEMIYDAHWADIDNDGVKDLVVAGHWMPITIFYNRKNGFVRKEIAKTTGLWFSIGVYDVNEDGKLDILAGNFGENHRIKVDENHPMNLYLSDFDNNQYPDPIISYYKNGTEYPYANLELMMKQLPSKKKRFQKYSDYSNKRIDEIFSHEEIKKADLKSLNTLTSQVIYQTSSGWEKHHLPKELQLGPIWTFAQWQNGFVAGGNLFDVDPNWGKQDGLPLTYFDYNDRIYVNNEFVPILMNEIRSAIVVDSSLIVASRNSNLNKIIPMSCY